MQEVCVVCGTRKATKADRCGLCAAGRTPQAKRLQLLAWFEKVGPMAEAEVTQRSIGVSGGKLIAGWAIILGAVLIGSFVPVAAGWIPSLIACVIALAIVNRWLFAKAPPLDKKRWERFWHGVILGYWLTYVPLIWLTTPEIAKEDPDVLLLLLALLAYPLACLVGLAMGFLNIARTDKADRAAILTELQQWRLDHPAPAEPQLPPLQPPVTNPAEPLRPPPPRQPL